MLFFFQKSNAQILQIPSFWKPSSFEIGTGDGGYDFNNYNTLLNLHWGLAIGSPFTDDGNGGYIKKATIIINGRNGNLNSIGNIFSNTVSANSITTPKLTITSKFSFPNYNNNATDSFNQGTGDGASLTTYNTMLKLHWGLAIGSPFANNGSGGYIDKATIIFNGRNGNITTQGLIVSNKIHSSEVLVDLNVPGPDYVFEKDYNLPSLEEIENYIHKNKHLPEIASATEMQKNGINLSEINMSLLKKIEEMTLYMIEIKKENTEMKKNISQLQKQITTCKK